MRFGFFVGAVIVIAMTVLLVFLTCLACFMAFTMCCRGLREAGQWAMQFRPARALAERYAAGREARRVNTSWRSRLLSAVSALLWAASAYAALAYFNPVLRFGPLDHDLSGHYQRLVRFDGVLIADGTVSHLDIARGGHEADRESARLWGIKPARMPFIRGQADVFLQGFEGEPVQVYIIDVDPTSPLPMGVGRRRILARVYTKRGRWDLAEELVLRGLARWDRSGAPRAYHLRQAEEGARAARRGMWAAQQQAGESGVNERS
jgi:hypothetical protein